VSTLRTAATHYRPVERSHALALTEAVIKRLIEDQAEWPLCQVTELYVFGSLARGASRPGDVDLDVEFDPDDPRWEELVIDGLSYGRDPHRVFRAALVGRKRGIQFQFRIRQRADFDMTLLWKRGEGLQTALGRLHAIKADPTAERAERHAMLPQFVGLDRWIPRAVREYLIEGVDTGAIAVQSRAANAVFGYLIERGIDPAHLHLHGRDVQDEVTPYFAGFSLRRLRAMPRCLLEFQGREWIEVVHPTSPVNCTPCGFCQASPKH
jgi:hypothetical protein